MLKRLKSLIKPPNQEQYVLTTEGNVGRLEKTNEEVGTVVISFGSFNGEGQWIPSKEVTISKGNVEKLIDKKQCASHLSERYASKNQYKGHY